MGGCGQDPVLPDAEWPLAVSKERCADTRRFMAEARCSEWPIIQRAIGKRFFV